MGDRWSRDVLLIQIENGKRTGNSNNNFNNLFTSEDINLHIDLK